MNSNRHLYCIRKPSEAQEIRAVEDLCEGNKLGIAILVLPRVVNPLSLLSKTKSLE